MSTKSKLLAKTGDLQLPPEAAEATAPMRPLGGDAATPAANPTVFPPVMPGAGAKTAPGQMLEFRSHMMAKDTELANLRERLNTHEGSLPTRPIDPSLISASSWANRHADAFRTSEFERLKADILQAGGNVQPIKVRPLPDTRPTRYELVFGHRRHRACAELGLPVLAMIDESVVSDAELFVLMDRENREREDLSPYEQGTAYKRALDAGLYPSRRRLAEALGVSHTWVSNVLLVAELPTAVLECFRSPLDVQHRHAKVLAEALEHDSRSVMRRAEKVRAGAGRLSAGEVVAVLTKSETKPAAVKRQEILVQDRPVGRWSRDGEGRVKIEIDPGVLAEEALTPFIQAVTGALQP
jgi:ParB family transcriptional regulator, chromosome partitioning protein